MSKKVTKVFRNNDILDADELNEIVTAVNSNATDLDNAVVRMNGEIIKLIKGTSENSSAMEYPQVYKDYQASQFADPVAEAMAHMDSIGKTPNGIQECKNVGVTILNVNGNCWRLHTFVQSYASQVYVQKIEGALQWDGTKFVSSTDYHEYTRKRTSAGWGEWKEAMSGSDVDLSNANDINVASTHPGDISPDGASIVVREANRMGEGSGTVYNSQAPRIGFDWKGRWWAQILMVSNVFKFVRGKDDTNWAGIQAGTIQGTAIKTTSGVDLDALEARVAALEAKLNS